MTKSGPNIGDMRDTVALLAAHYNNDKQGVAAILNNADLAAVLSSLLAYYDQLLNATYVDPVKWFRTLHNQLDQMEAGQQS